MRATRFTMVAVLAGILGGGAAANGDQIARRLTGNVSIYTTTKGDTLQGIGARFGIDVATLAADNELNANAPLGVGLPLRVDNRHLVPASTTGGEIVVNVPQRMLFYEWENAVAGLPVAIGQPTWRTPRAAFTVLTKETNPSWEVPASIRRPSMDNATASALRPPHASHVTPIPAHRTARSGGDHGGPGALVDRDDIRSPVCHGGGADPRPDRALVEEWTRDAPARRRHRAGGVCRGRGGRGGPLAVRGGGPHGDAEPHSNPSSRMASS
jgi:LysM repeat protein